IDNVYCRVVAKVNGVVGVLRRVDVDDLQKGCRFFSDRKARVRDLSWQLRNGKTREILYVDRVDVGIGAQRKSHVERVASIRSAGRLVVESIVDAVDLFLDRLRHRRFDDFCVSTWIVGGQGYLWRDDIGKLSDRDDRNGNYSSESDHDRYDDREPRTINEDAGKHSVSVSCRDSRRHHLAR